MIGNWIKSPIDMGYACPTFRKQIKISKEVQSATAIISARGVYEATLNEKRIGDFILAPGYTCYDHQIQYQTYDITDMLSENNVIDITLGKGWYRGRIITFVSDDKVDKIPKKLLDREPSVFVEITITYKDGTQETVISDDTWLVAKSKIQFAELYDGEVYDATFEPEFSMNAVKANNNDTSVLVDMIGEKVVEQERLKPIDIFKTPKGEMVVDFGQNMTGYPEISLTAKKGDRVRFSFAEILDIEGNFYNANYRSAKCQYDYTCKDGFQTFKPTHTFYGFRYVRVDEFPFDITVDNITAIVVHSDLKRTGYVNTTDTMLSRLYSNALWGQKSNYLDVPTDCPQRDERYGWTGDTQVFAKTASYNYDISKFMKKWLSDMRYEQLPDGGIPVTIPSIGNNKIHAAWADAVTIVPWQMYLTYGDIDFLKSMLPAMKKWVDCIGSITATEFMWTTVGRLQLGDWLEINAEPGSYRGKTRGDLVATAFYANSTDIVCKAGRLLGEDVSKYEELYKKIVAKYKEVYADNLATQTEHILSLKFHLVDDEEAVAKSLAKLIIDNGSKFDTGFVGTAYILEILGKYGYNELAYELLLREEYPSWLYSVKMGATTIWEHWDGMRPDGQMWSTDMNSFNHYAYGSVAGWMYEYCAGINTVESAPGFKEILFQPHPTDRIEQFGASIETRYGIASSRWWHNNEGKVRYEIITPTNATAIINGKEYKLTPGKYMF